MTALTADALARIAVNARPTDVAMFAPLIDAVCREFDITTRPRLAAFLSMILEETGSLRWLEEIWQPTAAQKRYEGRRDLGNVVPGDGYRYRGRGLFQLTGRANYRLYGRKLHLPLVEHPELAALPLNAARIAGLYWTLRGINARADRGDLVAVTRAVNGGLNGYADRERYYRRALEVLPEDAPPHRVYLGGIDVTGHRLGDRVDGLVVNASRTHRTDIRAPWVPASNIPRSGPAPSGRHLVFLNGVPVWGQRLELPRLVVNDENPAKAFVDRRN